MMMAANVDVDDIARHRRRGNDRGGGGGSGGGGELNQRRRCGRRLPDRARIRIAGVQTPPGNILQK